MSDEHVPAVSPRRALRTARRRGPRWPLWLERWPAPARIALVSVTATIVALALVVAFDVALAAGRIHPGVSIGDLPVGRMSVDEAVGALSVYVARAGAEPVAIAVGEHSWSVGADEVGLSVDATALAGEAFAVGRGEFGSSVAERARALLGGVTVPLRLDYDADGLEAVLAGIRDATTIPAVDAAVVVEGVSVTRISPEDGLGIDGMRAAESIVGAFLSDERAVTLDLIPLPPAVTSEGADAAYQAAVKMVSGPVTLYYDDKRWEVPASTIGGWIDFRRVEATGTVALEAYLVSEEVSATVLPMVEQVGRPAKDAAFKASSGTVTIVPAEDGLAADAESLATRLAGVLTGDGVREAELTMHRVQAARTTADAEAMGIVERIATFTTEYASGNKPRVNNIHVLTDALNGTLIPPGGVFSFNETIGQRTAAKGYQEANAIVNGKLVPQLGGGICQVGTTIFNTVFFSGLPVVERRNHSQYISSYPKGRDATVSWGGPDFKFKNVTEHWVLIATSYTNSSVTISLYGTGPGYEVTYETGPFTDLKDPPVREVEDPDLPLGSKVVDERGVSGRTIVVTRMVRKGGTVVRTDTFKSVYRAVEEVVRVGTKPIASEPATPTP
jgi:vancomycin resistance protein YoaR